MKLVSDKEPEVKYDELYHSEFYRLLTKVFDREKVRCYQITDISTLPGSNKVLIRWEERKIPLTDEELKFYFPNVKH